MGETTRHFVTPAIDCTNSYPLCQAVLLDMIVSFIWGARTGCSTMQELFEFWAALQLGSYTKTQPTYSYVDHTFPSSEDMIFFSLSHQTIL